MVDVDKMSDAELRTKLNEFGYPVMPITGTTRKLMVKKLKLLMENNSKGGSGDRRSLGRYSSEEESDTDIKAVRSKERNRRITMAVPPVNRNVSQRTTTIVNDSVTQVPTLPSVVHTTTKRTSTKVIKSVQDEFDTGSDSEADVIEVEDSPQTSYSSNKFKHVSPSYGFRDPPSYSTPKSDIISSATTTYSSGITNKVPTPPRYSTLTASTSTTDPALDRLNQIRSRLSLGSPGYERHTTYTPSYNENKEEPVETPFLSNFTKRLSAMSAKSPKQEYGYKSDIKEHDANGANDYGRSYLLGRSKYRDPTRDYYTRHDSNIVRNNLISFAVLGVAFMFFVVVGVMYWGMRSSDSALETSGYSIPFCSPQSLAQKYGIDCINETDLENTILFMKTLKPELTKRALNYACTDTVIKPYMTEPDAINYYLKFSNQDIKTVQHQLQLLEVLIFKNPAWEISMIQVAGGGEIAQKDILNDMNEVIELRPSKTIALAVLYPDIPWKCTVYNKLSSIFKTILVLAGGFFTLYVINLGYKYYKIYQQHQKDEVINMVERIIDVLQNNTSEDGDNFLVINHVRDMILPINDRKRMEKAWDQAVKFINENESRVRTEVQVVKGEPYDVWRWISCPSLNTSGSPRSNTWQGQAFETQVGSVNSLPCSPTPCLKIRGMVDDAEQNIQTIREAVLSKCAHQCRILHCAIDSNSKCVYLKCADQKEAAVAYRNLHGWWYSGHLVTVKYLRLERYMQRFPDSPVNGPPFLKSLSPATDWSN